MSDNDTSRPSGATAFQLEEFDPAEVTHFQPAPLPDDEPKRGQPQKRSGKKGGADAPSFNPQYQPKGEKGDEEFRPIYSQGVLEDDPIKLSQIRLKEAEDQAREAARQAREMVEQAAKEADAIKQKAYDEGFAQGNEDGAAAGRARVEAALDNLNRMVSGLDQANARAMLSLEPEMVALVQACVDRIFLTPGAVDKNLIRQVVSEAVRRVAENEVVTITVSPADLELIREFQPSLLERFEDLKRVKLQTDPEMHAGDCLVASPTAQVEGGLAERRERILGLLEEGLRVGGGLEIEAPQDADPAELDEILAAKPDAPATAEPKAEAGEPQLEELEDW